MVRIALEGRGWQSAEDFYQALLGALGAPGWHGHNLDALEETLRAGDANALNPPLHIEIAGLDAMGEQARKVVERFRDLVTDLRAEQIELRLELH